MQIRGAAIMLALWALFLLSALVISWALDINARLAISGEGTRMLRAEAVACSGAEVALHPSTKPGSPNLSGQLDNGASYRARLTGEGGRIDLNWVAAGPGQVEILRRYLENKGIDLNERDTMIDSLLDWVQPGGGLHRLNAPEESDDYHPAHAPFARVDELKKVAGWAEFTSVPGWDDDFTVNSGQGIDIQWASRDVLLALPGMTNEIVDRFLQLRQGPDQIDGTEDDVQFKTPADFPAALGLNAAQSKVLDGLITTNSPVFRVVSVGTAGKATRTVQMVFRRVGLMPQLLTWKEF
jgi:general secretion pathway protein K